jgi:hypothetical protein
MEMWRRMFSRCEIHPDDNTVEHRNGWHEVRTPLYAQRYGKIGRARRDAGIKKKGRGAHRF